MTAIVDLSQLGVEEVPVTPIDLFPREDRIQFSLWLSEPGMRVLREASRDLGIPQAEIARRGLAMFLAAWQAERRRKLAALHGLSDAQIAQAKQIFDHLPSTEIPAGEKVYFDINQGEDVLLVIESTGVRYALFKGCAVRMARKDDTHSHLTLFRHKQVIEEGDFPLRGEP